MSSYPASTRDVLLEIAERNVYRPLWSSAILDELTRTIRKLRGGRGFAPDLIEAYIARLTTQMNVAFPDAIVTDWAAHVASIQLPDPDDLHVVAAAVAGRADVIVTDNVKDFPTAALPKPLFTQTADTFLLDSLDLQPEAVCAALYNVAARTARMGLPRTPQQVVDIVGTYRRCELGVTEIAPRGCFVESGAVLGTVGAVARLVVRGSRRASGAKPARECHRVCQRFVQAATGPFR